MNSYSGERPAREQFRIKEPKNFVEFFTFLSQKPEISKDERKKIQDVITEARVMFHKCIETGDEVDIKKLITNIPKKLGMREIVKNIFKEQIRVIKDNLKKMDTEMVALIMEESRGGNAGIYTDADGKEYVCVGCNGYYKREDGQIIVFGNIQEGVPRSTSSDTENNAHFIYRVAIDQQGHGKWDYKIVGLLFDDKGPEGVSLDVSKSAKEQLMMSMEAWNAQHEKLFKGRFRG